MLATSALSPGEKIWFKNRTLLYYFTTCHFPTLRKPQALPTSPWHSLTPKLSLYLFHFLFHCPLQRFPLQQGMNPSQAVPASRGH